MDPNQYKLNMVPRCFKWVTRN